LKQSFLYIRKGAKNDAMYRQKMDNDLVTELSLFDAFFCIFPSRKGSKTMY